MEIDSIFEAKKRRRASGKNPFGGLCRKWRKSVTKSGEL